MCLAGAKLKFHDFVSAVLPFVADPIWYVTFFIILYYIIFKIKTEESSDDSDVIIESEFIKPLKQGNGETSYDL
jgi:hypothetical protein